MRDDDSRAALMDALSGIRVLPLRLSLRTPGVRASAPMLRGVWGAALAELDQAGYRRVFEGRGGDQRTPLYVIRPAAPDPEDAPAVDCFLIGDAAVDPQVLLNAWNLAATRGLGPRRTPFDITRVRLYLPDGSLARLHQPGSQAWRLGEAAAYSGTDSSFRLSFPSPLRILRRRRLITRPTLVDLTVAGLRRVAGFAATEHQRALVDVREGLIQLAGAMPAEQWSGGRLDLHRWSARQQKEVELRGVTGSLVVTQGTGPLGPLLAASKWLHLGKGTTLGLGQVTITPHPQRQATDTR